MRNQISWASTATVTVRVSPISRQGERIAGHSSRAAPRGREGCTGMIAVVPARRIIIGTDCYRHHTARAMGMERSHSDTWWNGGVGPGEREREYG